MPRNERLRHERIARNWRQIEVANQVDVTVTTVQRWERGIQQPSAYYRAKLSTLFGRSAQELGLLDELLPTTPVEQQSTEPVAAPLPDEQQTQEHLSRAAQIPWNVPFARNPFFTGRSDLLERLHERLHERLLHRKRPSLIPSVALSGLGGIGKTQTAIEYAYRYREAYRAVFWVRAESRDTLTADSVAIAHLLALPGHDASKQMEVVASVTRWLHDHEDWLLILDNADDLSWLPDFLPQQGNGHLLLTTRAQATGSIARKLAVDKMEVSEGLRLLVRRATLLEEDEPLETLSPTTRMAARQLVEELDGLPLALDQAGAYIEETGCSLSEYLTLYTRYRLTLLTRKSNLVSRYPHTVASTWTLSFAQVEAANAAAADLLRVCAFLHPDAIPEEIVTNGATVLGPRLQSVVNEPLQLNEVFGLVRRYSLVKRDAEAKLLNLHRLVQLVLKESLDAEAQRLWAERALLAVNAVFPRVQYSVWSQCERLLSQALAAAQLSEQYQLVSAEAGRLLHETATYLYERARYAEAEPLYQRAVRIREQSLGTEHPDVAASLNGLANLYRTQGRNADAEPLYQRALIINEQQVGPEHPDTATTLNNLAILYFNVGRMVEAERLYQRALAIDEKVLGPDHLSTVRTLSNLAVLYAVQHKYAEAESLFQRTLYIRERHEGLEHSTTATSLMNLAELYREQGRYEESEPLYQRALAIQEKIQGPEYPSVASSLDGLATLYQLQGRYAEAEPLYRRALHIREQRFGLESHWVGYTLERMAALLTKLGKYAEAESCCQRALVIAEKRMGSGNSWANIPLLTLANLYKEQGKYAEAEALYQQVLQIREKLGTQHPKMAEVLHDFATFQEMQGNLREARSHYQRALSISEEVLGTRHPKTMQTRTRLSDLLHALGQHEDAAQLEAAQRE